MERVGVGSLIWYPGVLAAGLAGGFVGNVSTTLLFVLVGETLFYFLSLCFTALMAALCAVLAGNALAGDGRRVGLWAVVVATEAAGVLAALANVVFVYAVGDGDGLSRIGLGQQMGLSTIVVALVSGLAAGYLRRSPVVVGAEAPRDARSALLLILLASLLVVAGVVIDGISSPVA
jgi:hypothetical protein